MSHKCVCRQGYCCDHCWARSAKQAPCTVAGCKNPEGHGGEHGPLKNTQVITISVADILAELNR